MTTYEKRIKFVQQLLQEGGLYDDIIDGIAAEIGGGVNAYNHLILDAIHCSGI
jgi:hypothetical protein